VVDALYYMHPGHKEKILKAVAKSVESALARFYEHHPDYKARQASLDPFFWVSKIWNNHE
jgi:hypothetical protein